MFYQTKLITAAAATPVTLTEAKAHLRIDASDTTEDTGITTIIKIATDYAEKRLGMALINQTWEQYLDEFPDEGSIELKYPPLSSITHVKYYDENDAEQTFASTNYYAVTTNEPGILELKPTSSGWPTTYDRKNAVTIRYIAGYGAAETAVPELIRGAIKLLISHFFENREAVLVGASVSDIPMPKAVEDIFNQYCMRDKF